MKKKMDIKKIAIITLCGFLLISFLVIWSGRINLSMSKERYSQEETLKSQLERGQMQKSLGVSSIYPTYYAARHNGNLNDDEIKKAIIEEEALLWYAKKNDILVTDEELTKYMNQLVADLKESEEYNEFQKSAKALGTTLEKIIAYDSYAYKVMLIKSKLYDKNIGKTERVIDHNVDLDSVNEQNLEKWESFVNTVVAKYKNSYEYNNLIKAFDMCEYLSNNNIKNTNVVKQMEKKYGVAPLERW